MKRSAPTLFIGILLTMALPLLASPERDFVEPTVKLPLADYLALVELVQAVEQADTAEVEPEPAVSQVVSQQATIVIDEETAAISSQFRVEIRGEQKESLKLPVSGLGWQAAVEPSGEASLAFHEDGISLATATPGIYTVTIDSVAAIASDGGVSRFEIAPGVAPVAVTEIDLDAELAWSCAASVLAEDSVDGARRRLRLALGRNQQHTFEMRRELKGGEAEKVLARTVVVTVLKLEPDGVTRHDVVLYEVSRGKLAEHSVELPPDLAVLRLGTDEGDLPPLTDGRQLLVQRSTRLSGTGYLVIESRPEVVAGILDLAPVEPAVEVRARYLAISSSVAAEAVPAPEQSWGRADISDLPAKISSSAAGLQLVAAWRWQGEAVPASVAIERLQPADLLDGLIRRRETTTLLTLEGTLLHRDSLTVGEGRSAIELRFGEGTTLWSTEVNGLAVRTVKRDGLTVIPLPFAALSETQVEVVSVQQRVLAAGRSRISLSVPEVLAPVLNHRWRLLLPEGNRYRYASGDLRPTDALSDYRYRRWEPSAQGPVVSGGRHGIIRGVVTDDEDFPLPGLSVILSSPSLPTNRVAITDADGAYQIVMLPPGMYQAAFELPGFETVEYRSIALRSGQSIQLSPSMALMEFADQIEVTAQVPIVDTSRTGSGGTFPSAKPSRPGRKVKTRGEGVQGRQKAEEARQELDTLRQGLVGGVRPVPVTIPESGKSLILEGALPPAQVKVELDVKAK